MSTDRSACLFCKIYDGDEPTEVLYRDEDYIVFPDIKPAAKHHYLVITREHVRNAKQLTSSDKKILEDMVRIGKEVLEERGGDVSDLRLGFHWPPFYSIGHLHLHVISPASDMSFVSQLIFRNNSWWFVSPEYVKSRL
ncbi:adenosine 5'-monophosphoramidase HINT3-like isoform X1 [Schistocerca americana]|uniref:adenosine 5'-monophosphoramidase HINT3-like n=1 Tax=Schistocerca piceifrons TaxID=274613 RepID=UPI001F50193B|nr:adenosine 5'-monophosphoramidase HINT3-like isoform X1 [Schistocerca americana]XP_047113329.1 adenosine 5'-monophosphoramidase HINT3-like [Schistocerca piceifrons]